MKNSVHKAPFPRSLPAIKAAAACSANPASARRPTAAAAVPGTGASSSSPPPAQPSPPAVRRCASAKQSSPSSSPTPTPSYPPPPPPSAPLAGSAGGPRAGARPRFPSGASAGQRRAGLSESRRIARQRLAIRDSVKMSDSAIRRFGDSVIPRISGCQPDRAGPGWAQRQSYAAQETQATHLHYRKQTS